MRAGRAKEASLALKAPLKALYVAARPGWREEFQSCIVREIEQRRLFLGLPVAFGIGILLFFQAEGTPFPAAPLIGAGLCGVGAWYGRHTLLPSLMLIGAAFVFLGFAAGIARIAWVDAPILRKVSIGSFSGFIEDWDERERGARLLVRVHRIEGLSPEATPRRIRVTVRNGAGLKPGDFVAGKTRLLPPPEAARPGGYDFARDSYFKEIGAVGSLLGPVQIGTPPHPPDWSLRFNAFVDEGRVALTQRIARAFGGQAGAVTAALVTGKRGLIDEDTNTALRAAGIYHIVSISGLHMVLAAGTIFWIVRASLALVPAVALFWPIKKIAAASGMVGAVAYCLFSGSDVATERSLFMVLVIMGAILVDRPALSLRNLAISALVILAREPESLLGPSFQMSFGAVAALIAFAEWERSRKKNRERAGWIGKIWFWGIGAAIGLVTSTSVATLATAPFSVFHFQNLNPYGIIGNALALPLVSVVIMPGAVLGVLAFPFGLDKPIWSVMGWATEQVLIVSAWIGTFEGSISIVPAYGAGGLILLVAALLIFTILTTKLRFLAAVPALAGAALALHPERADIYIDRMGAGAAIRSKDGALALVGKTSSFVAEQWLRADGDGREADDPTLKSPARCDPVGCVVETKARRTVSYIADGRAFEEDCKRADIIITRLNAPVSCKAGLVIDRGFLESHGATSIRLTEKAPSILSVRREEETRPWLKRYKADKADAPKPKYSKRNLARQNSANENASLPDEDGDPGTVNPP